MTTLLDYYENSDPGSSFKRRSIQSSKDQPPPDNENIDESSIESKDDSIKLFNELRKLSTEESASICEKILLKSGYKRVKISAISRGTYIEGDCIIEKNAFLYLQVLFRLERNENSIDSKAVRGFRTAMRERADKGILMTTNTFTMDAEWEAARRGVLPIKLVDRYKLMEMINEL